MAAQAGAKGRKNMKTRIAMIGAGSGFSLGVATPLCKSEILKDATFVLMDLNAERVENMGRRVREVAAKAGASLTPTCGRSRRPKTS
jgi:alpha-galactosidase/6-phospho-beta-glucosidase family protein